MIIILPDPTNVAFRPISRGVFRYVTFAGDIVSGPVQDLHEMIKLPVT
jgi:hypothetical protein